VDEEYQTNEILKKVPLVVHEVQNNNLSKREVTTKGINNEHILDFEKKISYENIMYKFVYNFSQKKFFYILGFLLIALLLISLITSPIFLEIKNLRKKINFL
ncbi:MAG: hypothetical protein Q8885_02295, partial [Candidatus Phytoplasma stylosanthis]|nr:hypothetical protein [Candidatus Phytoplasma stylosanthis]